MDEQIKSKRLSRSFFFLQERYAVYLSQKAGCMVTGDVEFFLLLGMRDLNKLTSIDIMLDTC